jgi:hypothetical protein
MSINVREYVQDYEARHPKPVSSGNVPEDPSKRWFKKDALTECIDSCRYELFKAAQTDEAVTETHRRSLHARYAALQSDCSDACRTKLSV